MAENIISNSVKNHGEVSEVANWISQINAGGTVYDIATHHGITFKDGKNDETGVVWNGLSDLEIVIPNITDIVQTPIEFAGTVGADGKISWIEPHGKDGEAEVGNLVFITADCTFESHACEAGDMAIYDGSKWNIVTGENQVELVGTVEDNKVTVKVGAAADVLKVEGKTLSLVLDYTELDGHVKATGGKAENVTGTTVVADKYLKLKNEGEQTETIGKEETLKKADKLANGNVSFTGLDALVTDVTFGIFDGGKMPEIVMNSDDRVFNVAGGSLTQTSASHFITGVSLGAVTFESASEGDSGVFSLVNGIQSAQGQAFLTGIEGKNEFTVEGYIKPTDGVNATYVTGLEGGITKVVTSITEGSLTFDSAANTFVTGLEGGVEKVITGVTATAKNDTSVLNKAKVENHVLSFDSTNVASGVDVQTTSTAFTKGGYAYTAPSATTTSFTTGGFVKVDDVTYKFGTANETTYTTTSSFYKLNTPELQVSKGGYELSNEGMKVTVAASTFAVGMTAGTLPTLTAGSVSKEAKVTGSVATDLTYVDDVKINVLKANDIKLPGAYSLVEGSADAYDVVVGAAGTIDVAATVDLSSYLTGVSIVEKVNA